MAREQAGFQTPWGEGSVTVVDGRLVEVTLPVLPLRPALPSAEEPGLTSSGPPLVGERGRSGRPATAPEWAHQIEAYFTRERLGWTADEVDLGSLGLTPFRAAVYRALLGVRPGTVVTYGDLGAAAGRPRSARAVGSAMAENPLPLVVPCHRVVRGDGTFGRYGDDERWKPLLLALEGALPQGSTPATPPATADLTPVSGASRGGSGGSAARAPRARGGSAARSSRAGASRAGGS